MRLQFENKLIVLRARDLWLLALSPSISVLLLHPRAETSFIPNSSWYLHVHLLFRYWLPFKIDTLHPIFSPPLFNSTLLASNPLLLCGIRLGSALSIIDVAGSDILHDVATGNAVPVYWIIHDSYLCCGGLLGSEGHSFG